MVGRIEVRVTPRAAANAIQGIDTRGRLRVRVSAPPVEGAANAALVRLLAEVLGTPSRRVTVVRGEKGRTKWVEIEGMTDETLLHVLQDLTGRKGA